MSNYIEKRNTKGWSTKFIGLFSCFLSAIFLLLPLGGQSEKSDKPFVVICPATGMVDDGMKVVIKRAITLANEGAKGFILEVDTPGGLVDSAVDITNILLEARCPTVAYIHGMGAISAGALISYACKYIVMAPGSNIGASAPITIGEAQPSEEFNEKTKSYLRSRYRSLAEVNGHNPLLAEAMVDSKIEVWGVRMQDGSFQFFQSEEEARSAVEKQNKTIPTDKNSSPATKDHQNTDIVKFLPSQETIYSAIYKFEGNFHFPQIYLTAEQDKNSSSFEIKRICKEGELLTLTFNEALEYGLSCATIENIDDVLKHFHWEDCERIQITPTWGERLFKFLVNPIVAGILLLLGIGGLYIEMKTPGFGLPGTIGLICLALFFGAHLVIGLANWADLLLLIIGIILLAIEIFLIPGFGLTGIAGLTCIIIGVYLSLTRVVIPEYPWDFERLNQAGQTLTISLISFSLLAWVTWKYLPRTSYFQKVMLTHTESTDAGYTVQDEQAKHTWIGAVGIAETVLRPAGKGRFQNITLDVVSVGDYIEAGTKIRIIEVQGNRYVVAPEKEDKDIHP